MPKILNYTPPWLTRPSSGSEIFTDTTTSHASESVHTSRLRSPKGVRSNESYRGPRRLLAKRGTEIFTVVDNKIRWADLARVKNEWEEQTGAQVADGNTGSAQRQNEDSAPYRVGRSFPK
jgi:nucleoporin NUP82